MGDTGYTGTFDGCGHVIKNLSVTGKNGNDILSYGIFGTVSGTIKKLCVDNFSFNVGTADCRAGAVAGQVLAGGEISDCYVINSSVLTGSKIAGSVVGCTYSGKIKNCYAYNCSVSAYADRGGFVVGDCRADGGDTDRPGYVDRCYAADCTYTPSNGNSTGRVVSSQSVAANITNCDVLTIEELKSGKAAYLLNNEHSSGVWGQDLTAQNYPVLGGSAVYKIRTGLCSADECFFSNTNSTGNVTHDPENAEFENGFCKNNCGYTQSAVLTTDKYDIDGDSNKDNVYEIANAGQLKWFSDKVNNGDRYINGVLTDNINYNDKLLSELITVNEDLSATVNNEKTVKSLLNCQ